VDVRVGSYGVLEAREYAKAAEHLKQADMNNRFDVLLLVRADEKLGNKEEARKDYQRLVDSQWPGIKRPLAYSKASHKTKSV